MKLFTRITLILMLCLSALTASAVTAGFTADVTSGCAPLVVHFTNTSTGATTYSWDLGNGTLSTLKDVSGTYLTPGTYTVKLVSSGGGSSSTYTMTITVYPLPTISFFANKTSVCPGEAVTFTSTTVGGVPGPMKYSWNFGDGYLGSTTPVNHTYATPGNYNVTLSVTNATGCLNTLTMPAYMHVFNPPVPNFAVSNSHFCSPPGVATFTNLSSGTPTLSYKWYFGDGGSSTATNPTYTYAGLGTYTVKLITKDGNGCIDSMTIPSFVSVNNVKASFTAPSFTCLYSTVTFNNTSTGSPLTYQWSFGDGGTSTLKNPAHTYNTGGGGTYNVKLIIDDGFCTDTVIHPISIKTGPPATIVQTPLAPCPPPVGITFSTPSSVPGMTSKWLFSDGGSGTGSPLTHIFPRRGVDTISLIATDPATGCSDTVKRIDTLFDAFLTIIDTPAYGCRPLKVNFSAIMGTNEPDTTKPPRIYPWPIASYSWNFGDGSPLSTLPTPAHTYTAIGVYWAHLTVTTSNGCTFTDSVKIKVGDPPTVTGLEIPTHICYGQYIKIPITVTSGLADEYWWDFGPPTGKLEETGDTLYMYFPMPGIYTVTVSASYLGCEGPPYPIIGTMTVDSPMAMMGVTYSCSPRNLVNFFDNSLGDDTHLWMFGDGGTSTLKNPAHTYPTLGIYTVKLATYNARTGCRDTASQTIDLRAPAFDFVADRTAMCRDGIVHISPVITVDTPLSYDWYVNGKHIFDPYHVDPTTYVLTDTFFNTGLYTVSLVIRDKHGCSDTLTKVNYLTVAKPVAAITVTPPVGCRPLKVTFTDVSTDVSGVSLTNFDWTFGDGATALLTSPTVNHVYTSNGTYMGREIVTDNLGCKDTVKLGPITVSRPTAAFHATKLTPCAWESVYFINNSLDFINSEWDFGDGTPTVTTMNAWHSFASTGSYNVRLIVTDAAGCKDTALYPSYITVSKPTAAFHMSDSFSVCPPLTVVFYNTSSPTAYTFDWSFGDGNTSAAMYPSNLYTGVGHDTVRLVVTDGNGCTDTATSYVDIFGYAGAFSYTPLTGCSPLDVHFKSKFSNVASLIFDFADGVTSPPSVLDTASHVYIKPGAYVPKLILSDNTGCQNSSIGIDTIKVDGVTFSFSTDPSPVCERGTFTYKDLSKSYYSTITQWFWTFNGTDTSSLRSPSNSYSVTGTYPVTLRVTDGWGCTDTGTLTVTVLPPPKIVAKGDTMVCVGDGATLTGYGGQSYTWAPIATVSCTKCNPTTGSPAVETTYTVTGTDEKGCTNTDTVTVRLKTKTISVGHGDTTVCFGVVVPLSDSGADKFRWVPAAGLNNSQVATPTASPDTTTNYMVIAQLGSCQPDTNYVLVTVHPAPAVDAGPDQTIAAGMTADIRAAGSNIFGLNWGGDSTLSCNNCLTPKATPLQTTAYVIHVTSTFGCPNTDTVVIHVYCDKSQLFLPNTFTPNGDGENDVFYPRGRGIANIKSFRIYNRWGQMLFERSNFKPNDISNAWDGSYNGDIPRPDVFVYIVEAVCDAGDPVVIKGDVTIIR